MCGEGEILNFCTLTQIKLVEVMDNFSGQWTAQYLSESTLMYVGMLLLQQLIMIFY